MRIGTAFYTGLAAIGLTFWLGTLPAQAFVTAKLTPTNQVALVGYNATFTAQVSTTAGEVITGYTWQMSVVSNTPPFYTIPGATNVTYTRTNVQTTNAGYYFVKVYYSLNGTPAPDPVPSESVKLVVPDQARIETQPQSLTCIVGTTNVSFSVVAAGSAPLSYQWRVNGTNLVNSPPHITGAKTNFLTLTNLVLADSGSYTVVVSNVVVFTNLSVVVTNSYTATSQVATLSVLAPPGIGVQPQNTACVVGSNTTLSVTPTGTAPFSYQWLKDGTNVFNGGRISGATNNLLAIAATITNDSGGYHVIITNAVGSVTSSVAVLTVLVPPAITSATNVVGRQGLYLSFTNTATGSTNITFGASSLPLGLSLEPTNGVISGTPLVTGVFNLTIFATNAAATATGPLTFTFTTGIPGITSGSTTSGKQGSSFTYTIRASNSPTVFTAAGLPAGLNLNVTSGVISGVPIVSGVFAATVTASNQFGGDSRFLTLTISSAVPVITGEMIAVGTENQSGFSYTIQANNSPTLFGASDLPLGLVLNSANGVISGTPLISGAFTVPVWAANGWGTGSTNVLMYFSEGTVGGLIITNVTRQYQKPYLLNFTFSLRDGPDPATSEPVVRPPSELQVVCMEDGVPISSEAPLILKTMASKQLKTFLVLDYSYSIYSTPGAIDSMEAAAQTLINEEPPNAQFGIVEFSADYLPPNFVTNSLTRPPNYFVSDKYILGQSIAGIRTNYVKGNYAGSRCWDAMYMALTNFGAFNTLTNTDERRYLVAMSDGYDESSQLNGMPGGAVPTLIAKAITNHVAIYCIGYGDDVNTPVLQELATKTGGRFFLATSPEELSTQFQKILKELEGQYDLRWATLKRYNIPSYPDNGFQPSFQVSYGGLTAAWNTNIVMTNFDATDYEADPVKTNIYPTNVIQFPFNPPNYIGDVLLGSLRLLTDPDNGLQRILLRTTYTPRYVRTIKLNYRPNYPCTASLASTDTDGILYGWTMSETADTNGLRTLILTSSDTNNTSTSIPYAAFGDLVKFDFAYPDALTAKQAFSVFSIDNKVYTNMTPSGTSFTNENFANFITPYPMLPPHETPLPWLQAYGFPTNNAAAVELIVTNGLPLWAAYQAGLNPISASSRFALWTAFTSGQTPQVMFNTVAARTYRLESSTTLNDWVVLRDGMAGTGGYILFIDNRTLTGVRTVFYRVAVY